MRKGSHLSAENLIKISNALKDNQNCLGRVLSPETKRKIGLTNKDSHRFLGKHHSEETKSKMSLDRKGWQHRKGCHLSGETKSKLREARLRQVIPTKDTSIELKLQNELTKRKIPFKKHEIILKRFQVDLFIEPNIIIEADGDYWHSKEIKNGKTWEKDMMRNQILSINGYKIYRFWEREINKNVEECIDRIEEVNITNWSK